MRNALSDCIEQYNKLIKRQKDGAIYLDNPNVPMEERSRWIGKFQEILSSLNALINEIENKLGRKMTKKEILEGFIE
ncbi:MAG TPA: hypothetical protein DIW17_04005 [Clostridiales bacterium]|nr:hypothetical protein [Clostridiales bacterium]